MCLCCLGRKYLMHTGYVSFSKLPRTEFNCIHLNLYSLQKTHTVCRSCGTKVTTNPKLGQNRKSWSIEEKHTYNYLLIVFIVTLYSLQKNTKFVDRAEQKVTTNPELGQNCKRRSTKEEDLCF